MGFSTPSGSKAAGASPLTTPFGRPYRWFSTPSGSKAAGASPLRTCP